LALESHVAEGEPGAEGFIAETDFETGAAVIPVVVVFAAGPIDPILGGLAERLAVAALVGAPSGVVVSILATVGDFVVRDLLGGDDADPGAGAEPATLAA
jgi:hypothetical protein